MVATAMILSTSSFQRGTTRKSETVRSQPKTPPVNELRDSSLSLLPLVIMETGSLCYSLWRLNQLFKQSAGLCLNRIRYSYNVELCTISTHQRVCVRSKTSRALNSSDTNHDHSLLFRLAHATCLGSFTKARYMALILLIVLFSWANKWWWWWQNHCYYSVLTTIRIINRTSTVVVRCCCWIPNVSHRPIIKQLQQNSVRENLIFQTRHLACSATQEA